MNQCSHFFFIFFMHKWQSVNRQGLEVMMFCCLTLLTKSRWAPAKEKSEPAQARKRRTARREGPDHIISTHRNVFGQSGLLQTIRRTCETTHKDSPRLPLSAQQSHNRFPTTTRRTFKFQWTHHLPKSISSFSSLGWAAFEQMFSSTSNGTGSSGGNVDLPSISHLGASKSY